MLRRISPSTKWKLWHVIWKQQHWGNTATPPTLKIWPDLLMEVSASEMILFNSKPWEDIRQHWFAVSSFLTHCIDAFYGTTRDHLLQSRILISQKGQLYKAHSKCKNARQLNAIDTSTFQLECRWTTKVVRRTSCRSELRFGVNMGVVNVFPGSLSIRCHLQLLISWIEISGLQLHVNWPTCNFSGNVEERWINTWNEIHGADPSESLGCLRFWKDRFFGTDLGIFFRHSDAFSTSSS